MAGGEDLSLEEQASYLAPTKECDLVMKGGITSGVVYPLAICRLATTFRLRQIGGTSAGAIAAAFAAAAEHGRDAEGFIKLAALPAWLAGPAAPPARGSNLRSLFQPARSTRKLFAIAMALVDRGSKPVKAARLIGRALVAHPIAALGGALPGLQLAALAFRLGGRAAAPGVIAGLILAAVGGTAALAVAAVLSAGSALSGNGFGLCPGSPGLTDWLASQLDDLAGVEPARPLTFGDLKAKGIELRMLTTCLTHGVPYRLPFEDRRFLYSSTQLRGLFPAYVVDHLDRHARAPSRPARTPDGETLVHLPPTDELPVVVAVRMSLSFPVLLSAIPLWAVDFGGSEIADVAWFSDGGISSNFPVHFFDALLPMRPTFALNLGPTESVHPSDERQNIVVPAHAGAGILPRWTRITGVVGFARAVLDTMQNWSDNNQVRLPGYRDRVIRVLHTKAEGGLNLDMSPGTITKLTARGEAAAAEFLHFDMRQHRWTRYRSTMALLEATTAGYLAGYTTPVPGIPSYDEMIDDPPSSYSHDWTGPKATFARKRTEDLVQVAEDWPHPVHSFAAEAPSPAPVLRVTPDV